MIRAGISVTGGAVRQLGNRVVVVVVVVHFLVHVQHHNSHHHVVQRVVGVRSLLRHRRVAMRVLGMGQEAPEVVVMGQLVCRLLNLQYGGL
jgi:hypothetical protein